MTGYSTESHKDLKVFSGRAHPALANQVANELGIDLVPTCLLYTSPSPRD